MIPERIKKNAYDEPSKMLESIDDENDQNVADNCQEKDEDVEDE